MRFGPWGESMIHRTDGRGRGTGKNQNLDSDFCGMHEQAFLLKRLFRWDIGPDDNVSHELARMGHDAGSVLAPQLLPLRPIHPGPPSGRKEERWIRTASARNSVNGPMSPSALAASSAAMYGSRCSTRMIVQGYPPEASMAFIRNRPMRPLPSM